MFKISQYGPPLQIIVLSVVCYCVSHYHSYIPWHTHLSISCFCDVTPTHPCTAYTWHKRCVHVLCISFLCDVAPTHPLCAHGTSWMYRCARQKSLLNSYPSTIKSILTFHIQFSFKIHSNIPAVFQITYFVVAWTTAVMAGGTSNTAIAKYSSLLWCSVCGVWDTWCVKDRIAFISEVK